MRRVAVLALALLLAASAATAHEDFSDLAFHPHPGARLPLLSQLQDESGRAVTLAHYFAGGPVVLLLQYLRCRDLCALTLKNLLAVLPAGVPLVVLSIDPHDTPAALAAAKRQYAAGAAAHFLTASPVAVRQIADAIGFSYRWDADAGEYVHPAGFVIAGPDGRIDRYFLGIAAAPSELRAGVAAAAQGSVAGPLTRLLLLCHLGAPVGRWTVSIEAAFGLANLAAVAGLLIIFAAIRRRRRG